MAAVLKNVQTPKAERHQRKPGVEDVDGTVEVELPLEVFKWVMTAAKASGQTMSDWICGAIAEDIERRSKRRRNPVVTKQ